MSSDIEVKNILHPQHGLDTNGAYWMTTFWHILVSCKMEALNPLKKLMFIFLHFSTIHSTTLAPTTLFLATIKILFNTILNKMNSSKSLYVISMYIIVDIIQIRLYIFYLLHQIKWDMQI